MPPTKLLLHSGSALMDYLAKNEWMNICLLSSKEEKNCVVKNKRKNVHVMNIVNVYKNVWRWCPIKGEWRFWGRKEMKDEMKEAV